MTEAMWRWPVVAAYQHEEWMQFRRSLLFALPLAAVVLGVGLLAGEHPFVWIQATAVLLFLGAGALSEVLMTRRFGVARAFIARNASEYAAWRRRIGVLKGQRRTADERWVAAHETEPDPQERILVFLTLGRLAEARAELGRLPEDSAHDRYVARRLALLLRIADAAVEEHDLEEVRDAIAAVDDPQVRSFALADLVLLEACVAIVGGGDWIAQMRSSAEAANAQIRAMGRRPLRDRPVLLAGLTLTSAGLATLMLLLLAARP